MEAGRAQIEPGRVIGEAFDTYGKYAGPLLGGAVVLLGGAGLANGLLRASGSLGLGLVGTVISLLATVLYTGYTVKVVQDVRDGRLDDSLGELLSAAMPYVGTLILNGIIFGVAVLLGLALVIVPGLILITIWSVVGPSIVVENRGAIEAFGRSRELVRGNGWPVFGAIVIAFVILIAVYIVAAAIGAAVADDAGTVVMAIVANIIAAPVPALVSSILFFDLEGGAGAIEPSPEAAT